MDLFRKRARGFLGLVGIVALMTGRPALAADPPVSAPDEAQAKAAALFAAKDWAGAVEAYQRIVSARPSDAPAWYNLGAAHHALGHWQEAVDAYSQAGDAGYAPVVIATRLSRVLSRKGEKEAALAQLEKAVKLGFARLEVMDKDPDFEPIRSDPRFAALLLEVRKKVDPCSTSPRYRDLDFWLGEWEVQVPAGTPIATSRITSILSGCAIEEDYSQNDGALAGRSLSAWSEAKGHWLQRYVDSKGDVQEWEGEPAGPSIRFLQAGPGPDGRPASFRMTYTPDGPDRVRQLIELSSDGGKSWTSVFDALYVRKKS